ncbi:MAG: glycosyltransferase [Pyrinomonadaceae bacterium]
MTLPTTAQDDSRAVAASDELVSVIIPCYNQGQFLGEAIESLRGQSYRNFEVIVVDDGSTDNTQAIAARYSEVRTIRQDHAGTSTARNLGFRESNGNWLVFLDSDDRLLPHALEIGLRNLRDRVECAFVFGRHQEITGDGTAVRTAPFVSIEKDPYGQLLLYNCVYTPSTAMFRRNLFEAVGGFDPRFLGAEDYDLYLRIARRFPIFAYDEVVAEYRRHDANYSGDNAQMLRLCLGVMRKQKQSVQENKEWKAAYHSGLSNWRKLWGEKLVSQVWSRVKRGKEWRRSARDMMVLLRYGPAVFPRQLGRKLLRPLRTALIPNGLQSLDLERRSLTAYKTPEQ